MFFSVCCNARHCSTVGVDGSLIICTWAVEKNKTSEPLADSWLRLRLYEEMDPYYDQHKQ